MLTKPFAGWTNIEIEDFSAPASYLTDVPVDCLKGMIYALKNGTDFIASFDAEGWTYKVIADEYRTIILEEKDLIPTIFVFENKTKIDLAQEIYFDISSDKEGWSKFPGFLLDKDLPKEERESKEYYAYKSKINGLLKTLEKQLGALK